jgi:N-acetylglucosaminyldiphosphoundecaprenol N-acetyl-beta-D-mannosaminyltransferase
VLFVAMSTPKKEIFLRKWKYELRVPFVMGVGRTFDVVAGLFKRAPVWMQRCGLEWFTVWDKSRAGSGAAIWQKM